MTAEGEEKNSQDEDSDFVAGESGMNLHSTDLLPTTFLYFAFIQVIR